jgi:3-deoxy-manno-octulosonate cytidylyltransferase (CMP-KDO synthetase)
MKTVGIIPARWASSRLPGKLLLARTGKTLLQYTWEAACRSRRLAEVIVATDSSEIFTAVKAFGGRAEMTGEHASGTDRIAEVARRCCPDADLLVNVQGDEPELDPRQIDALIDTMRKHPATEMATLAAPIQSREVLDDPSCTKVVCAKDGRALYFSRAAIPVCRDASSEDIETLLAQNSPWKLHLGIYAYRRDFLLQLTQLPASPLERLEKLEQLRALEAGAVIQVAIVEHYAVGIDTPTDYAQFVARQLRAA